MNRTLLLYVVLLLCWAHSHATAYYSVIKDNINVRADSTILAHSLGYLTTKDHVEVIAEQYDWYKIVLPKRFKGFVLGSHIHQRSEKKGEVIAPNLNIRQEPSLAAPVIGRLQQGTVVSIRDTAGDWLKIDVYPYAAGWVHKQFLRKESPNVILTEEDTEDDIPLSLFVQHSVEKLSQATAQERINIQEELAGKGQHVITLLEKYLSEAKDNLAYSVIAVFSSLVKENQTLIPYFLKKADSDSPRLASIYLDVLENVLQPEGPKKAYFYMATNNNLSTEDINSARKSFQTMYENTILARKTRLKP